ncbi:thioredoxin family protein [Roseimaritima ulvae]|uniref:YHS domain protein n=1 Tax=Roseimaritima ulvae TaxID=980254 RepID=A0A5B9QSM3_9BACT|nr:thioredoxin family protein [Roseimaritima ulvae]QEG40395.1 YHS domain protein [Roseimaritima ulvae]
MRSTILTIAGFLLLSAPSVRAEIPWNEDLRAAHQQAEQQGKLLLLHFYTDNCHWCDKLEDGAFQSPQLAAAIGPHYVPVKIHAGKNPTLAKTFKVSRFPTDVIVSTDGTVLAHGVSPQATTEYVGMLARYSGQAPASAQPMHPAAAGTQIAGNPAAATMPQAAAPANATYPAATPYANMAPHGGPAPQINQFAMQTQRPAQTNPYAPQAPTLPAHSGFAAAPAPTAPAPAAPHTAAPSPAGPSAAQLSLPMGNLAAAPAAAPAGGGFAMPPSMPSGVPAQTVGHRTEGMMLQQPAQIAAPQPAAPEFAAPENAAPELAAPKQAEADLAAANAHQPPPLAMQGYCPVAVLDQGEWVAGDPQNGLIHLGQLYLFSSPEAMDKFRQDPEVYTPVMNGMDVVLFFEERRLVQGSREWGVTDPEFNRMFFFANEETMNHFNREHARYTRSAMDITRQAAMEANATKR